MNKIFCFTDIHGRYDFYQAIMDYCHEQDEHCTIIYLGDACDRGPDGYKIMKDLLSRLNVVYLKGNHEDMFVKAAREIKDIFFFKEEELTVENVSSALNSCKYFDERYDNINLSLHNGGLPTLVAWILDGMPMDFVSKIDKLQLTAVYDNVDFSHSCAVYKTFNSINILEENNYLIDENDAIYLTWSRSSFEYAWPTNRTLVFGHTPTLYLPEYATGLPIETNELAPIKFRNNETEGYKIDIDTGAVFTNNAYVLNILTMQAQGFTLKDGTVEKIEMIQY